MTENQSVSKENKQKTGLGHQTGDPGGQRNGQNVNIGNLPNYGMVNPGQIPVGKLNMFHGRYLNNHLGSSMLFTFLPKKQFCRQKKTKLR